jgi:hypothetical protein
MTTDYKGSRDMHVTPRRNPNELDMIQGPKVINDGAAPRQILDIKLFLLLPLIPDDFRHGTNFIGKFISLPF